MNTPIVSLPPIITAITIIGAVIAYILIRGYRERPQVYTRTNRIIGTIVLLIGLVLLFFEPWPAGGALVVLGLWAMFRKNGVHQDN